MKRVASLLLTLSLVLALTGVLSLNAFAADTSTKDGLNVSIETDKSEYLSEEDIQITVTVENTNRVQMNGLTIQTKLPKAFELESGTLEAKSFNLEPGETYSVSGTAKVTTVNVEEPGESEEDKDETTKNDNVDTGDHANVMLWSVICIISLGAVIYCISHKKGRRIFCLFLCLVMITSVIPVNALAANSDKEKINVNTDVIVDNEEYMLESTVTYAAIDEDGVYRVNFDSMGGTAVDTQKIKEGELATQPEHPTKENYVFAGWYTSAEYEERFDFDTPIYEQYNLVAKWIDVTDTTNNDKDELIDVLEEYFGTDDTLDDTDNDGVDDCIEVAVLYLDPLNPDTDNNGILDGDEDSDGDTIINRKEQELGLDPSLEDTDLDTLKDQEEIEIYGTDPALADTDADGVSDGKEIELGTDPTTAEESFEMEASAEDNGDTVSASVEMELSGEQVETLSVVPVEDDMLFPEEMPGYIGKGYEFNVEGNFDEATIKFEFDESKVSDDADLVICYYNEEEQELEPLETTVTGNVAQATVTHFSKYILIDRTKYEESFKWIDVWDSEETYTDVEVILVIDDSGSMDWNDGSNKRLSVAKTLIDNLPKSSKVGVVKFGDYTSKLTSTVVEDKELAKSYLTTSYFKAYGGTYMYDAINDSFDMFDSKEETTLRMMIVLSDGDAHDAHRHSGTISAANTNNVKLFTVGLGSSTSYFNSYLKPLAENTGGAFYLAANASDLSEIYKNINEKIDIETDSDEDGIPDYYEDNLVAFNGMPLELDKNKKDTDGDGLKDGEELKISKKENSDKTQIRITGQYIKGHPALKDTDGDGILDPKDSRPFKWDVSYRDLALLSEAVYKDWKEGTIISEKKNKISTETGLVVGKTAELQGWKIVSTVYNTLSGFQAAAYVKDDNLVIATRGSESHDVEDVVQDWIGADAIGYLTGLNAQLPAMEKFVKKVVDGQGKSYDKFHVTGHSLGGYLALMASSQLVEHDLTNDIEHVVTFNGLGLSPNTGIGIFLDINDNVNLAKIKSAIKNYRTNLDVVSVIGYTPGDDVTIKMSNQLKKNPLDAHSMLNFVERFANEQRRPEYIYDNFHGLNDERK